jgi:hypothetical protein
MYFIVYFNYRLTKYYIMRACWILLCMSLKLLSYASLLNKEGIGKNMKSKGGLEGSTPWPVAGWGCYRLVSELMVETPGQYGSGLLVRVSWSRSNSDREVENLRRNGIAESKQDLYHQRPVVRGSKDRDRPLQIQERSSL